MNAYEERLRIRFWQKVSKKASKKANGCWEWTGAASRGYGRIGVHGKSVITHRLSWVWANGKIPKGMCVLHKCDNPPCVNPKHLFLGTLSDNTQDCIRKGRHNGSAGGPPCTRLRTPDGYVWCRKCQEFLPKKSFYKKSRNKSHGCSSYCKKCSAGYQRAHHVKRKR